MFWTYSGGIIWGNQEPLRSLIWLFSLWTFKKTNLLFTDAKLAQLWTLKKRHIKEQSWPAQTLISDKIDRSTFWKTALECTLCKNTIFSYQKSKFHFWFGSLKILYSSHFVVSSKKSNFETRWNFELFW